MSRRSEILIFLVASLLIFQTLFVVTPLTHLSSSIHAKLLSLFHQSDEVNAFSNQDYRRTSGYIAPGETMLVDEKDVVVLSQNNFSDFISSNQYVMLNFYASWCSWSQKLAPDYAEAANMLKGEAFLAKIDATANQNHGLAKIFNVEGYPTLYLLVGGVQRVLYDGERTGDAIETWVRQKMNPAVQNLTTVEEAECILSARSATVMAFLNVLAGPESEELASVLKLHLDVNFYQTADADVARMFYIDPDIKLPALVLLKKRAVNHTHFGFDGQFTSSEIDNFVSIHKLTSVITFKEEHAPSIFRNHMKQLWLFAAPFPFGVVATFEDVADHFKGKLLFVRVETMDRSTSRISYEFGIHGGVPTLVAYDPNGDNNKHVYRGELSLNAIKAFAEDFLEDKLSSQPSRMPDEIIRLPVPSAHNSYLTRSSY